MVLRYMEPRIESTIHKATEETVAHMRAVGILFAVLATLAASHAAQPPRGGFASWYGETHRGRLMANGRPFNPDKFTAASWFYPLGTKVQVTLVSPSSGKARSVLVTITDRGPDLDLVREGRIIDLAHAAFKKLAEPDVGLVRIRVAVLPTFGRTRG